MLDMDRLAENYWNQKDQELERMPICSECNEHIQDEDCIELPNGKIICNDCENDLVHELWFEWGRDNFAVNTRGLAGIE